MPGAGFAIVLATVAGVIVVDATAAEEIVVVATVQVARMQKSVHYHA